MTKQEADAAQDDVTNFLNQMNQKSEKRPEETHYKRAAEQEKFKGNEFMSSKEYMDAIAAYTSSIQLDGTIVGTYSNRALAYLSV